MLTCRIRPIISLTRDAAGGGVTGQTREVRPMLTKEQLLDRRGYAIKEAHRLRQNAERLDREAAECARLLSREA